MILKKPNSPRSSLLNIFQDHLSERSPRSDIHRSFFMSRKHLTVTRIFIFLYSILSLIFVLYHCTTYHSLLTLPYWSLALQTVYFGLVLIQSFKGKRIVTDEGDSIALGILYELVFSFQLFNLLYYWMVLFPQKMVWDNKSINNIMWLSVTVLSFISIWIEQFFNMMRFHSKHVSLVIGAGALNFLISYLVTSLTGGIAYIEMSSGFRETLFIGLMLTITPAFHFIIGNTFYQRKRHEKNNRRKKLGDALVSYKAVRHGVTNNSTQEQKKRLL